MDCINLKKKFGKKYRISWDESRQGREDDPWLQQIAAQRGHFYPQGGNLLGFATNSRGPTTNTMSRLPGVVIAQEADDGMNLIFPLEAFEAVAKLAKPRRKRQMSEEQRKASAERLAKYRKIPLVQTPGAA